MLNLSGLVYFMNYFTYFSGLSVPDRLLSLKTAGLLVTSSIFNVDKEYYEKQKIASEWLFCGRKCLVGARGQRKGPRLLDLMSLDFLLQHCDDKVRILHKQHIFCLTVYQWFRLLVAKIRIFAWYICPPLCQLSLKTV